MLAWLWKKLYKDIKNDSFAGKKINAKKNSEKVKNIIPS
jgi:hypothetical protein